MGQEVNLELRELLRKGGSWGIARVLPRLPGRPEVGVIRAGREASKVCVRVVSACGVLEKNLNSLYSFVSGFSLLGTNHMLWGVLCFFYLPDFLSLESHKQ